MATNSKPEYDELDQFDYVDTDYFDSVAGEYRPLIGEFVTEFSLLEHELNLNIAEIINDRAHDPGYIVIEKLTTSNKIDLFCKFYVRLCSINPELTNLLKVIKSGLIGINKFRNYVVHANWYSLKNNGFLRTKICIDGDDGYVKFKNIKMSTRIIRGKIKEISNTIEKLDEFEERISILLS